MLFLGKWSPWFLRVISTNTCTMMCVSVLRPLSPGEGEGHLDYVNSWCSERSGWLCVCLLSGSQVREEEKDVFVMWTCDIEEEASGHVCVCSQAFEFWGRKGCLCCAHFWFWGRSEWSCVGLCSSFHIFEEHQAVAAQYPRVTLTSVTIVNCQTAMQSLIFSAQPLRRQERRMWSGKLSAVSLLPQTEECNHSQCCILAPLRQKSVVLRVSVPRPASQTDGFRLSDCLFLVQFTSQTLWRKIADLILSHAFYSFKPFDQRSRSQYNHMPLFIHIFGQRITELILSYACIYSFFRTDDDGVINNVYLFLIQNFRRKILTWVYVLRLASLPRESSSLRESSRHKTETNRGWDKASFVIMPRRLLHSPVDPFLVTNRNTTGMSIRCWSAKTCREAERG